MNKQIFVDLLQTTQDPSAQFRQLMEEAGEVIQEVCKLDRHGGKRPTDKLIEEMGDLMNTIESILVILNIDKTQFDNNRYNKVQSFINKLRNNSGMGVDDNNSNPPTETKMIDVTTIVNELSKTVHEVGVHNFEHALGTEFNLTDGKTVVTHKNIIEMPVINPINDLMRWLYKILKTEHKTDLFIFDVTKMKRGSGYMIKLILI
jgi:NTP pyrophosphatase (non-canonical NTP hydrolase)